MSATATLVNALTQVKNLPWVTAETYDFAPQTPGGSLTAGNRTIPMSPVPVGLLAGNYLYISGGTGTAEAVPIMSVGGSSIVVAVANTHSGAWTIQSATGGIQEAIQASQGSGAIIFAGGASAISIYGNINFYGSNLTLQLTGSGLTLVGGSSIVVSGTDNATLGTGSTPIIASSTSGDIIRLIGCLRATIKGLFLDRSATPAISGAGINIASGTNTYLIADSLTIHHHYRGIWLQVAPVVSRWSNLSVELSVTQGIEADQANDEHFENVIIEANGGNGLQLGAGSSTTYFPGSFKLANAVVYNNGGDGIHIEGAVGQSVDYVFLTNVHADTDTGYELYLKYCGAVTVSNSMFVNGTGVKFDTGTTGVVMSGVRINGSTKDGLYLTGGTTNVIGAGIWIGDSSLTNPATYACLHIDGGVTQVEFTGIQLAQPDTTTLYGVQIAATGGNPSLIHLNNLQILYAGNITTPVSVAAGLTDIYVDVVGNYTWQALTLTNGWTANSDTAARLTESGNVVRLKGTIAAGTTTDATAIFTLPAGMRPVVAVAIPVVALNGGGAPAGVAIIQIATSGVASIYTVASNAFLRLDAGAFSIN